VLVVANRGRREVVEDGIYVVDSEGRLVVEKGRKLGAEGVGEAAAKVLIVVRPPKDEDDRHNQCLKSSARSRSRLRSPSRAPSRSPTAARWLAYGEGENAREREKRGRGERGERVYMTGGRYH
jgi:hypothetical protein